MPTPAIGNYAILGRAIEKSTLGIPQGGFYDYLRFENYDLGVSSLENPSKAITGAVGMDQGTPGRLEFGGAYGYDLTCGRLLFDLVAMHGKPFSVDVLVAAKSWLVKIRPRPQGGASGENEPRAASFYAHDGQRAAYPSMFEYGRRNGKIILTDAANDRVRAVVDYGKDALGHTISAFAIPKTGNAGTYTGKITTRGLRPFDADYDAGKSLFVKVSAIAGGNITLVAQMAAAGDGLGGGFPVSAYGTATFVVKVPNDAIGHDGFTVVKTGASATPTFVGLEGENHLPYQFTFGTSVTGLAVDDAFEIPVGLGVLSTSYASESRFSTFHLDRYVENDGVVVKFNKGTTEIVRPYKPNEVNGQRYAQTNDESGDAYVNMKFNRRRFDEFFSRRNLSAARFTVHDIYKISSPIPGTTDYETIEFFYPKCAVYQDQGRGKVASKDALDEDVTLQAEQPNANETAPSGFENTFVWGCNCVTSVDPTPLF